MKTEVTFAILCAVRMF